MSNSPQWLGDRDTMQLSYMKPWHPSTLAHVMDASHQMALWPAKKQTKNKNPYLITTIQSIYSTKSNIRSNQKSISDVGYELRTQKETSSRLLTVCDGRREIKNCVVESSVQQWLVHWRGRLVELLVWCGKGRKQSLTFWWLDGSCGHISRIHLSGGGYFLSFLINARKVR